MHKQSPLRKNLTHLLDKSKSPYLSSSKKPLCTLNAQSPNTENKSPNLPPYLSRFSEDKENLRVPKPSLEKQNFELKMKLKQIVEKVKKDQGIHEDKDYKEIFACNKIDYKNFNRKEWEESLAREREQKQLA